MIADFNQLLSACKHYERKAQRQMMDHLAPFLYGVCKRYEKTHPEIQDQVQEALILIFNNIEQFRGDEIAFLPWCRRIAINLCLQKIRKKNLVWHDLDAVHEVGIAPGVFSKMGIEEIFAMLDRLPEGQRLVFNLSVLDGYSHAEISEAMNIAPSHSRTLLTRAKSSLQALILKKESLNN